MELSLMQVLGLCGSLRRDSYNRRLLAAAAAQLPDDVVFHLFEDMAAIPAYNDDTDARETPVAVQTLRRAVTAATAILIATPEYNASVPGLLKNAIDWASRPYADSCLRGKPVIVTGASITRFGAALAQTELRRVLTAIGADVLEAELSVPLAHEAFAQDGQLADPGLRSQLVGLVQTLVGVALADGVSSR
jgi:chromate reductase